MLNLDRHKGPVSGLAQPLDEPYPSLAQNSSTRLFTPNSNSATACLEPQRAITILLDQHDDSIFAYLRFARSLDQNVHYCPGHGSLSSDQVLAVGALRDYADDEIRILLTQARKLSRDSEHAKSLWADTQPGLVSLSSGQVRDNWHAPGGRASDCASVKAVQTKASYQSTLNTSGVRPQQTLDETNTSLGATKAANLYWCTICEDGHSYKNLSDWRKHEKEHVDKYICMLVDPLEETEGELKCSLCGISNPSEEHLGAHKIQICGQGVPGSFSCKRRTDLVRHLRKYHDVPGKAQGEAIADKWKETTNKQAWSCGFCIHLAHTFGDRLKHIAKHFERGQTLDEWDANKVIEGLLLQSEMVSVWKTQLAASSTGWGSSEIIWKKHLVKRLQHDLEVGPSDPKHAAALAKTAYEARQPSWHLLDDEMPHAFAPTHGALELSAIVPKSDYGSIMERKFAPKLNHGQRFVANPAESLHYGVPGLGENLTAPYDYNTFSPCSSNDGSSSVKAPWLLDPGQTWSSAADQHTNSNGYQEHSNANSGRHIWPTSVVLSDEPDADDVLA